MKFLIFFTTGLILLIFNQICAHKAKKKCGGPNTEVVIANRPLFYHISNRYCYGEQIHSHAVIVPAYCIDGAAIENLTVEQGRPGLYNEIRNVSHIFIHPSYSHCAIQNDLAILTFDKVFNARRDIICLEDPQVIESDLNYKCHSHLNAILDRTQHYASNGVSYTTCISANGTARPAKYYTKFTTCTFYSSKSSKMIRSLYKHEFWLWNNSRTTFSFVNAYKIYNTKNWIDSILQFIIRILPNKSIDQKKKDESSHNSKPTSTLQNIYNLFSFFKIF